MIGRSRNRDHGDHQAHPRSNEFIRWALKSRALKAERMNSLLRGECEFLPMFFILRATGATDDH
jgi:hypothetical protein